MLAVTNKKKRSNKVLKSKKTKLRKIKSKRTKKRKSTKKKNKLKKVKKNKKKSKSVMKGGDCGCDKTCSTFKKYMSNLKKDLGQYGSGYSVMPINNQHYEEYIEYDDNKPPEITKLKF